MAKIKYKYNDRNLRLKINRIPDEVNRKVDILLDFYAVRGEEWMKTHAPWTDRTGAARNGLFTQVFGDEHSKQIVFAHSVEYGIYLETMESGQFQVINPAIRATGAELMRGLEHLLDSV